MATPMLAPRMYDANRFDAPIRMRCVSMTIRDDLSAAIKQAGDTDDRKRVCTLRLIQTAIRDRDQAHCVGNGERMTGGDIAALLGTMIKQREEQIADAATNRESTAQIRREIETIREFMPPLMDETSLRDACAKVVHEIGAAGLRDVGRTISTLKKRYPGQMDFARASGVVKQMLR